MTLMTIVAVFLVCNTIRFSILFEEFYILRLPGRADHWSVKDFYDHFLDTNLTWAINNFVMSIDTSGNIFIYCLRDQQFRSLALEKTGLERLFRKKEVRDPPNTELKDLSTSSKLLPHCLQGKANGVA